MTSLWACSYEPANQGISFSEISPNPQLQYKMLFLAQMRKRARPLSETSLEHCRDLGKRAKKVLKATPKVFAS